ncbi:chemotaxis protein CheA [Bacillus marinisedimentorum]|uniref:chemotaxis protein CheA n=1 Tax=Bacillus marinisedimentorum TaxID=1821260 RepID=UPI0007DFA5C9|nr:chemotaxis protein CheA [Bacillus marinisedimentorum]
METSQYLEMFIDESNEHLQNMNDQLLLLEKNPGDLAIVNEVFRSAHTLKGMSATMGYEDLANLTHKMENVLDSIRNENLQVNADILDVVFKATGRLEEMVESISSGGDGRSQVNEVVLELEKIEKGENNENSVSVKAGEGAAGEPQNFEEQYDDFELTVLQQSAEQGFSGFQVNVTLADDCLLKAARVYMVFEVLEQVSEVIKSTPSVEKLEEEEFENGFVVTIVSKESADDLKERILKVSEVSMVEVFQLDADHISGIKKYKEQEDEHAPSEEPEKEKQASVQAAERNEKVKTAGNKTIRVNIERLDRLMNLFEELVIDRGRLEQISTELGHSGLQETVERMSRISGDLQNIILNMRMVPVEQVFNRFPRMVRQLARDLNKEIDLEIIGAETELDRTVIDEIGDPLVHLIRNAIDHGIEMPDERRGKKKQVNGTVKLQAYHSGNHVFIEIEDDGAGINREKVLKKAVDKGIITKEAGEQMSDSRVNELIMASGFSTADVISDISGRGVGLDVVKNTIESLGGSIGIESELGLGTKFSIQLPLTLSIISVMLVEVEQEKYAVPLSSIIETAIIKKSDILSAHNQKVIDFRGRVVPLVFLKDIFDVPGTEKDESMHSVVITRKGDKMAGLVVDSFIGQQEIVLKSLGSYLAGVFAISGATILGDGQVALIIDSNALIR